MKKITLNNTLLEDIASAMNDNNYELKWYLDVEEEETILVSDYSDNSPELLESIEEGFNERFFSIPKRESREGWEQMERFIYSLSDKDKTIIELLLNTISGRGAFGRFKDALYRTDLLERWYEFKGREDRKETLEWLYSLDVITSEDIETGMRLFEEMLLKRKQQEKDIADMTRGTRVKCIYNGGHADKLTVGKTYNVLDERPENLLVRIKDDREKECWMPKSHFELLRISKA